MKELIDQATALGAASLAAATGRLPEEMKLLRETAPAAFAAHALMQAALSRGPAEGGALDPKTKGLVFVLLAVLAGDRETALLHLELALGHGLTPAELAEGLTQVMVVGGIGTWTGAGAAVMRRALELTAEPPLVPPPLG